MGLIVEAKTGGSGLQIGLVDALMNASKYANKKHPHC
jgi:hypothetical protein